MFDDESDGDIDGDANVDEGEDGGGEGDQTAAGGQHCWRLWQGFRWGFISITHIPLFIIFMPIILTIEGGIVAIKHRPPDLCWEGEPAGEEAKQVNAIFCSETVLIL